MNCTELFFIRIYQYKYIFNSKLKIGEKLIIENIHFVKNEQINDNYKLFKPINGVIEEYLTTSFVWINKKNLKIKKSKLIILNDDKIKDKNKKKEKTNSFQKISYQNNVSNIDKIKYSNKKNCLKNRILLCPKYSNFVSNKNLQNINKSQGLKKMDKKILEGESIRLRDFHDKKSFENIKILKIHKSKKETKLFEKNKEMDIYIEESDIKNMKENDSDLMTNKLKLLDQYQKCIDYINKENLKNSKYKKKKELNSTKSLSNALKSLQTQNIYQLNFAIFQLKKFWVKFASDTEIEQKEIEHLDWENKIILEAIFRRKKYSSIIQWNASFINRIMKLSTISGKAACLSLILRLLFNILKEQYTGKHYHHSKSIAEWLKQFPIQDRQKMGFLHFFFHKEAKKKDLALTDFFFSEQIPKNINFFKRFIALIYGSDRFKKDANSLLDTPAGLLKIKNEVLDQLDQKVSRKINNFKRILKRVDCSNESNYLKWISLIYNDIRFNPRSKFPLTVIDFQKAYLYFKTTRDNILNNR